MNYDRVITDLRIKGMAWGKPKGNSMMPRIYSGEKILFIDEDEYNIGDVVLCKVKGRHMVHFIVSIDSNKGYQIKNNKGRINGWTHQIYGKAYKAA